MTPGPEARGFHEFDRAGGRFDGETYLYLHEDVRRELGFDPEGAYRHWWFRGHAEDRYPPGLPRRRPRVADAERLLARPFGLTVWGPFEAVSGLGTAARNLAAAVRASGIAHEFRTYDVDRGHARLAEPAEATRPARYRVNLVLANADQIRHVVSLYDDAMFDDAYTIAVWAWELAAFRSDWHASVALVDEVWTNSRFELASLAASSLPVPLHLMPLPVAAPAADAHARGRGRRLFGLDDDAFVVLCPFDPGSTAARKNPEAAIRAFRDAFGADRRRVLVVKSHGATAEVREMMAREAGGQRNIRLLDARLPAPEMTLLQAAADIVLSAHRSEGFGLNIAEMLAAGRTAVATDTAGSRDFLDRETGFPVGCRPVPVGRRAGPYLADAVWAEPDHEDLVRQLRHACHAPIRDARAAVARRRMAERFSAAAIGARIAARLHALGLDRDDPAPPPVAGHGAASTDRFVPEDRRREAVVWPARLPMFSVLVDADRADRDRLIAGLRAQVYPFWEVLLHRAEPWPPPEEAGARAALRLADLRIRLVERPAGVAAPAPEVGSGAFLVALPEGCDLDGAFLLSAARRLDAEATPDLLLLAASPAPVAVRRKAALLEPAPDRTVRPDAAVSIRATDPSFLETASVASAGEPRHAGPVDTATVPADGFAELARKVLRGDTAEHVVLISAAVRFDDAGWLAALLSPAQGAATAAVTPIFAVDSLAVLATTRTVLRRVAAAPDHERGAQDPAACFGRLGLPVVPVAVDGAVLGAPAATERDRMPAPDEHRRLVRESGLLDPDHYLAAAPDVAASGTDPVAHYCEHGWRENRSPNFYLDPAWYRQRYMDAAADPLDPLLHYLRHRRSGVRPSNRFDPAFVRWTLHLGPDEDPLAVFLRRRRDEDIAPVPGFDPVFYRRSRRDLAYRRTDPFEHYVRHGTREGANPSAEFDTAFYRSRHRTGSSRGGDADEAPLLHWLANRDRPGILTSWRDALLVRFAEARRAGDDALDVGFAWYDGLPQSVDELRALLGDPTLDALPFRLVLRNEALASQPGLPSRMAALIRGPYEDEAEDDDVCDRLAECLADPRCLRTADGMVVIGVSPGIETARAVSWAERLAGRLLATSGRAVTVRTAGGRGRAR